MPEPAAQAESLFHFPDSECSDPSGYLCFESLPVSACLVPPFLLPCADRNTNPFHSGTEARPHPGAITVPAHPSKEASRMLCVPRSKNQESRAERQVPQPLGPGFQMPLSECCPSCHGLPSGSNEKQIEGPTPVRPSPTNPENVLSKP